MHLAPFSQRMALVTLQVTNCVFPQFKKEAFFTNKRYTGMDAPYENTVRKKGNAGKHLFLKLQAFCMYLKLEQF